MRVLSLDGMSAAALQIRLIRAYEAACPGFLRSVDVFVGASDGGYMALFLASRVGEDDRANLAMLDEAIAFNNALVPLFHLSLCKGLRFASGWYPLLKAEDFRAVFQQYLGPTTLGQLQRRVVIASYGAFTWSPVVYDNLDLSAPPRPSAPATAATTLVDMALATSAFPLALPMYGEGMERVVDGGWVATNPAMLGVAWLCRQRSREGGADPVAVLDGMRVLSLGAMESVHERMGIIGKPSCLLRRAFRREDWGYMQWLVLRPFLMLDMTLQGTIVLAHQEAEAVLSERRYHRIRPPMPEVLDGWRLLLGRPQRLIQRFDEQAQRLAGNPEWLDPHTAWIRDQFMGEGGARA